MNKQSTEVKCPSCNTVINVEDIISQQLEEEMRAELKSKEEQLRKQYEGRESELLERESELKKEKLEIEVSIKERLEDEREKLKNELKIKVKEDYDKQLNELNTEIDERKKEVQALKDKEIELERLKRKFDERDKELELVYEKKLSQKMSDYEQTILEREGEKTDMKLREKDKQLDDMRKQIDEMKRKAEQGSTQLQGEVGELALEDILKEMFPSDTIQEVPKGRKGADIVHTVVDAQGTECGKIVYEAKRTKNFHKNWIEKLKKDQLAEKADIAVLISEVLPEGVQNIGLVDDVWLCDFRSFRGLVLSLRQGIIRLSGAMEAQTNKGDKMEMLYNYLTSNEFKMQIDSIMDGFMNLKESIDKERFAMEKLWKEREKQLEKVLLSTSHFYGSIKGIAGSALPSVPLLELPEGDN